MHDEFYLISLFLGWNSIFFHSLSFDGWERTGLATSSFPLPKAGAQITGCQKARHRLQSCRIGLKYLTETFRHMLLFDNLLRNVIPCGLRVDCDLNDRAWLEQIRIDQKKPSLLKLNGRSKTEKSKKNIPIRTILLLVYQDFEHFTSGRQENPDWLIERQIDLLNILISGLYEYYQIFNVPQIMKYVQYAKSNSFCKLKDQA